MGSAGIIKEDEIYYLDDDGLREGMLYISFFWR